MTPQVSTYNYKHHCNLICNSKQNKNTDIYQVYIPKMREMNVKHIPKILEKKTKIFNQLSAYIKKIITAPQYKENNFFSCGLFF